MELTGADRQTVYGGYSDLAGSPFVRVDGSRNVCND